MKKMLISAVLALAVGGCSGILPLWPGRTPTPTQAPSPTQALSPTAVSSQVFLDEEMYPLLFEFQELDYAMQGLGETDLSSDLPSGIRRMADSLTAQENVDPQSMPLCAKAGMAQAIQGEAIILTTWGTIAYDCPPGPVAGFCYFDKADQDMKAGHAMLDIGIAQIETECEVRFEAPFHQMPGWD